MTLSSLSCESHERIAEQRNKCVETQCRLLESHMLTYDTVKNIVEQCWTNYDNY